MKKIALIAVDWGTSNFRAFILDQNGNILESRFAKRGLLHVRDKNFYGALKDQISDYLIVNPEAPIVMSGMVGSRQGWEEVPYLNCPVALAALATNLQPVKACPNAWIIPGVRIDYPDGRVDVMRGEEIQIFGSLIADTKAEQLFCLPGTHSKWAWIKADKLEYFNTYMTGEIFNLLFKHSILGKPVKRVYSNIDAFYRGLKWSERSEHLLSQLFQVRTQMLAGNLTLDNTHSFLSGLLIGHEIKNMLYTISTDSIAKRAIIQPVHIVANSHISQFYAKALAKYDIEVVVLNADQVTAQGIFKIASQAGLI